MAGMTTVCLDCGKEAGYSVAENCQGNVLGQGYWMLGRCPECARNQHPVLDQKPMVRIEKDRLSALERIYITARDLDRVEKTAVTGKRSQKKSAMDKLSSAVEDYNKLIKE